MKDHRMLGIGRRIIVIFTVIIVIAALIGTLTWYYLTPTSFSMMVTFRPRQPVGIQDGVQAMVGQRCIFLVSIKDQDVGNNIEPVQISDIDDNI